MRKLKDVFYGASRHFDQSDTLSSLRAAKISLYLLAALNAIRCSLDAVDGDVMGAATSMIETFALAACGKAIGRFDMERPDPSGANKGNSAASLEPRPKK